MLNGEPLFKKRSQEFSISRDVARGHTGRSKQSADRERGRTWVAHIRVLGWSALGFPGKGQIGQFKPKKVGFW